MNNTENNDNKKKWTWLISGIRGQRGAVAILVASFLVCLTGVAALVIDMANRHVNKNTLQNTSDAAALASTRVLGEKYKSLQEGDEYVCDQGAIDEIISACIDVAVKNRPAGEKEIITITDSDVWIGNWDKVNNKLDPNYPIRDSRVFLLINPDGVKVIAHRDGENQVPTFFARILGIDAMNVAADATAALLPEIPGGTVPPGVPPGGPSGTSIGRIPITVGVSERIFKEHDIDGETVRIHPLGSELGIDFNEYFGWHTYDREANTDNLKDILREFQEGKLECPDAVIGRTVFNFFYPGVERAGQDMADAFGPILELDSDTQRNNYGDLDEDPNTWTIPIVVYEDSSTSVPEHPEGEKLIVGSCRLTVTIVGEGGGTETIIEGIIDDEPDDVPIQASAIPVLVQ
ncbi:MAG: TadG family pilus assembly protein [bacterium]